MLGIIVALPQELTTLTSMPIPTGRVYFINDHQAVILSGVGQQCANHAAWVFIQNGATKLISWGCAGALSKPLHAGDLMIPTQFIDQYHNTIKYDDSWARYALKKLSGIKNISHGTILESNVIVTAKQEKALLNKKTSADVIDMESTGIASIAHCHGLPFLAIKAVADTATMHLPKAIDVALNRSNQFQISTFLPYLLTHPYDIPKLIALGISFRAAKKSLHCVAQQLDNIAMFP
jgi:adenosylhomocysteine nucleosidase